MAENLFEYVDLSRLYFQAIMHEKLEAAPNGEILMKLKILWWLKIFLNALLFEHWRSRLNSETSLKNLKEVLSYRNWSRNLLQLRWMFSLIKFSERSLMNLISSNKSQSFSPKIQIRNQKILSQQVLKINLAKIKTRISRMRSHNSSKIQ